MMTVTQAQLAHCTVPALCLCPAVRSAMRELGVELGANDHHLMVEIRPHSHGPPPHSAE